MRRATSYLARLTVRAETSKVRNERKFIGRDGEYFERLKERQANTGKNDWVFARICGDGSEALDHRVWKRHWMITQRIAAGVNVLDLAKITGAPISHIDQAHLKYSQEMAREAALKSFRFTEDGGIERY